MATAVTKLCGHTCCPSQPYLMPMLYAAESRWFNKRQWAALMWFTCKSCCTLIAKHSDAEDHVTSSLSCLLLPSPRNALVMPGTDNTSSMLSKHDLVSTWQQPPQQQQQHVMPCYFPYCFPAPGGPCKTQTCVRLPFHTSASGSWIQYTPDFYLRVCRLLIHSNSRCSSSGGTRCCPHLQPDLHL
jgi:hypothetical protein